MKKIPHQPLILFDGICNLCNYSVQFIIKNDKTEQFKFASIQSDAAKEILLQFSKNNYEIHTLFLIYNNQLFEKSAAVLRIGKLLGGIYLLFMVFWILPKPIRDWLYDLVARNRYKWFGRKDNCLIPTTELKDRFLY